MNPKKISLSNLKIGSKAIIDSLDKELQYKTRFTEMGIIPGKEILLMQRYSKKGPVCIKVMGSFVMIRKENADKIIVSKDTDE
tara:strand:- start:192 stop:440 length:249 start_codon:yes stop_codon:yes gene_type:complete